MALLLAEYKSPIKLGTSFIAVIALAISTFLCLAISDRKDNALSVLGSLN